MPESNKERDGRREMFWSQVRLYGTLWGCGALAFLLSNDLGKGGTATLIVGGGIFAFIWAADPNPFRAIQELFFEAGANWAARGRVLLALGAGCLLLYVLSGKLNGFTAVLLFVPFVYLSYFWHYDANIVQAYEDLKDDPDARFTMKMIAGFALLMLILIGVFGNSVLDRDDW